MRYIVTKNKSFFEKIGDYNYIDIEDIVLPNVLGVDTETTDLYPRLGDIFAIQVGTGGDSYLFDLQTENDGFKVHEVAPLLEGDDKWLIFHNAKFDLQFFYKYGFYFKNIIDTLASSKLLYNGKDGIYNHGFAYVMERELGAKYDKSQQSDINVVKLKTKESITYCFDDVDKLILLAKTLIKKLRAAGMMETAQLHWENTKAVAYMEYCGIPLSEKRWKEKIQQDIIDKEKARVEVVNYIYDNLSDFREMQLDMFSQEKKLNINLSSPKQMLNVFKALGVNIINDKGKESTKMDLLKMSGHEFIDIWEGFQEASHAVTTFGQNIFDKTHKGRVYTSYNHILDTARMSTYKGEVNTLNFPGNLKTRYCFQAKKGYKLIVADYSAQEAVVGADLHQDPVMVASVINGFCLHCAFARKLFPELEELDDKTIKTEHSKKRKEAKAPRFAFSYGGTGYTVAKNLNIPVSKGNEIEGLFKELHSGVYSWGNEVLKKAVKCGYIESAGGFRLHLRDWEKYTELQKEIDSKDWEFWASYKVGKTVNKMINGQELEKSDMTKSVTKAFKDFEFNTGCDIDCAEKLSLSKYFREDIFLYNSWKSDVSWVSRTRGKYQRLCLNNPIQATAAHQTKFALNKVFQYIVLHNYQNRVKICVVPHDEIVLEVEECLAEEVREVLENCMVEAGNYFLTSDVMKMKAEALICDNWAEGKDPDEYKKWIKTQTIFSD